MSVKQIRWLTILLIGLMCGGTSTRAVIIAGGDGQGNTTAPADDPGWANVGQIQMAGRGPSTVTYLGSNWFITAYHVWNLDNPTGVLVDASAYTVDTSSWVRLTNNSGPYVGSNADLAMFRVTTTVTNLPTLSLRTTSLPNDSPVTMIGHGYDRQTNLTFWTSSWNVTNSASGVYSGFYWTVASGTERWGTNLTDASGWIDDHFGISRYVRTTFDANGGANEAQGAQFDSGGGVFNKNGSTWQLAGMMIDIDGYSGQPANAAIFGDVTYVADLGSYHSQIASLMAVPEPASAFFLGIGLLFAVRMIRRWRT